MLEMARAAPFVSRSSAQGVPADKVASFQDPRVWLRYFPGMALVRPPPPSSSECEVQTLLAAFSLPSVRTLPVAQRRRAT
jgi:hypothetical protein